MFRRPTVSTALVAVGTAAPQPIAAVVASSCWTGGFSWDVCCDVDLFGAGGNGDCWEGSFSFDRCCGEGRPQLHPLEGDGDAATHGDAGLCWGGVFSEVHCCDTRSF